MKIEVVTASPGAARLHIDLGGSPGSTLVIAADSQRNRYRRVRTYWNLPGRRGVQRLDAALLDVHDGVVLRGPEALAVESVGLPVIQGAMRDDFTDTNAP